MARIMFVPWPEFGHVNPTLKLAKRLKLAGHTVCYAGLPDFHEYVRHQGLEFIPILSDVCPAGHAGERSARTKLDRVQALLHDTRGAGWMKGLDLVEETDKEIGRVLRESTPDLLICDVLLTFLVEMVVYEFGIPTALINVMLIGDSDLPTRYPRAEMPLLILCPKELDFPHSEQRGERYYIEPSIDLEREEAGSFPWGWLDQNRPLIYCSLGSVSHLYDQAKDLFRAAISAMDKRPQQLIVSIGPQLDVRDFDEVPDNVLVLNWAPQLEILKRASMMITHGGLGTVKECIFFSVPMVVFPAKFDQPQNAARIAYHGLGVRGDLNEVSARKVGSLIDEINYKASFRTRIEAMSKVFKQAEDVGRGVRVVESLLHSFVRPRNELLKLATACDHKITRRRTHNDAPIATGRGSVEVLAVHEREGFDRQHARRLGTAPGRERIPCPGFSAGSFRRNKPS